MDSLFDQAALAEVGQDQLIERHLVARKEIGDAAARAKLLDAGLIGSVEVLGYVFGALGDGDDQFTKLFPE